jgi:hypothetical protein
VAAAIAFLVFGVKGFFGSSAAVNLQIVADGLTVSGFLMTAYAAMIYLSSEGAFIGVSFVLRNIVLAFIPMGRTKHEFYAQYRERKLGEIKKSGERCALVTGLIVLIAGVVCNIVWYTCFYNGPI